MFKLLKIFVCSPDGKEDHSTHFRVVVNTIFQSFFEASVENFVLKDNQLSNYVVVIQCGRRYRTQIALAREKCKII